MKIAYVMGNDVERVERMKKRLNKEARFLIADKLDEGTYFLCVLDEESLSEEDLVKVKRFSDFGFKAEIGTRAICTVAPRAKGFGSRPARLKWLDIWGPTLDEDAVIFNMKDWQ